MYYVTSKEKIHHKEEIKMNEELRQLVEANTNEINALKEQYKGISPLLHELNYEIFEIIDELDVENNKELFEHLIKVSRMADILEERLRGKNGEMIERKTLSQFIKEIQSLDFIQIHKSYIINKRFIQEIKNQEVILKEQTHLPIGRSYKESLKEQN